MERFLVYCLLAACWCANQPTRGLNHGSKPPDHAQPTDNQSLGQSTRGNFTSLVGGLNSTDHVNCTSFYYPDVGRFQAGSGQVLEDGRMSCTCSVLHTLQCNGELYTNQREAVKQFLINFMHSYRMHPHKEDSVLDIFIQDLQFLPPKLFQEGELSGLTISSAGSLKYVNDKAFQGLESSLKILGLSNNCLENVPVASLSILTGLIQLDLSDNQISVIHSLPTLDNLEYLDVSRNELRGFASGVFQSTPHLKTLNLANNRLDVLSISGESLHYLTYLQSLDISNNQFNANLSVSNMSWIPSNLKSLDLSYNNLTGVSENTFSSLKSLSQLNLQNNDIQSIDGGAFRGLENLEILDLSHNSILTLCDNSFAGLASLTELNLSFNVIQVLSSTWLVPAASRLRSLYLINNDITTVDNGAFDVVQNLQNLDLQENPLDCDCSITYLVNWSAGKTGVNPGRCATPEHQVNARVALFNSTLEGCESGTPIEYYEGSHLYSAKFVSNSTANKNPPKISVKSADFQGEEGIRLTWMIKNVRGDINCDKIYIFQETESSFDQTFEDDFSCTIKPADWLRFPSKQEDSGALVSTGEGEYTLITILTNQMLNSRNENISEIICIKFSIDGQIVPGCTGSLELTNLDNQNKSIKLGASLLDQDEVSVLSLEAQSDLNLNANVSKDNELTVFLDASIPVGIQDQCQIYLTVNTPEQPVLGSKLVGCNESVVVFPDLPKETVFRVCALLQFSEVSISSSHKLHHSMQRKGHCVLAVIRYREKSVLPLLLTLVFLALGIACLAVLYLIMKPRKEDQGRGGRRINKLTLFLRLLTQRLMLRRNHEHLSPSVSE